MNKSTSIGIENNSGDDGIDEEYTTNEKILIAISMTILSLLIIIANALVVYIYRRTRSLQKSQYYFILSLAYSDFVVGLISVNMYTAYMVVGSWPIGTTCCYVWIITDFSTVTISNLTLLAIAVDRLLSVRFPMLHRILHSNRRHIKCVLVLVWCLSMLMWAPIIVLYTEHSDQLHRKTCRLNLHTTNESLAIVMTFLSYFCPLILLVIAYFCISYTTRRRCRNIYIVGNPKSEIKVKGSPKNGDAEDNKRQSVVTTTAHQGHKKQEFFCYVTNSTKLRHMKNNTRSTWFLLIISIIFAVTWFPYHCLIIVLAVTHTTGHISKHVWNFCYIFGWINSILNPVCYALGNPQFRYHFFATGKKRMRRRRRR